jgi:hypothetical protein
MSRGPLRSTRAHEANACARRTGPAEIVRGASSPGRSSRCARSRSLNRGSSRAASALRYGEVLRLADEVDLGARPRARRLKGGEGRVGQGVVGAPLSHSADVAGRRPPRKTVDLHGFERGARGTVLPAGTWVTRVNPRLLRVYERVRRFRLDSTAGLLGSARPSATRRSCCCQPVSHFQLAAAAEVADVTIKHVNRAPSSGAPVTSLITVTR